jgi:sulfur-oxidizing protein SoxX
MPVLGSRRLRLAFLVSLIMTGPVLAQRDSNTPAAPPLVPFRLENDSIQAPLTGRSGDPARGAALFGNRQVSTCLLCHADPGPVRSAIPQAQANSIGPMLAGVGSRLTEGQIRLRIVDAARLNADTVMPSFYVVAGLNRVGRQWQGKPILDAEQIEDLVAYLATLRSP